MGRSLELGRNDKGKGDDQELDTAFDGSTPEIASVKHTTTIQTRTDVNAFTVWNLICTGQQGESETLAASKGTSFNLIMSRPISNKIWTKDLAT